jgi:hypothetical protein
LFGFLGLEAIYSPFSAAAQAKSIFLIVWQILRELNYITAMLLWDQKKFVCIVKERFIALQAIRTNSGAALRK